MSHSHCAWRGGLVRFLSAQTISLFGSSLVQYAVVWHLTLTTGSGRVLTLSTLCGFLPQILLSLFAGVWLDRYDRKRLIMLSDTLIALSTLVLALCFFAGWGSTELLLCALVVRSAGTGVQTPAVSALLPQLVPQAHLMRAGGILSTLNALMMLLAPAASGALLSAVTLQTILLVDVVTAVVGVSLTATVPTNPYVPAAGPKSTLGELRAGFSYLKDSPFVRRLLLFQIAVLFLISPSAFLTPLMVSRSFGPEVWRLTLSEMTYGLGMVLGGVLISVWGGFRRRLRTTLLAGAVYGLLMLGLGLAPVFPLYLLFNTLIGVTAPCYNAPITVSIQERVPAQFHGRVFSLMQISTSCALPLGMVLFGPLADRLPVQGLLLTAGLLVLAATGWTARGGGLDDGSSPHESDGVLS